MTSASGPLFFHEERNIRIVALVAADEHGRPPPSDRAPHSQSSASANQPTLYDLRLFFSTHDATKMFDTPLPPDEELEELLAMESMEELLVETYGEGMGGGGGKGGGKEGDADWLSSIEMCLVCHGDVLLMQNWAHVHDLFELLNQLPRQARDTDFSRVRSWYLDGDAAKLRQSVLLAAHPSAAEAMRR